MSKTVSWIVVIIVIILVTLFFVFNKPGNEDSDSTTNDETTSTSQENTLPPTEVINEDLNISTDENRVTVTVEGSNFKYVPNKIEVKKGDTVEIVFKNVGGFHDFVINEFNAKTSQIKDGSTETITFVADKAGSFEYYCSVGTHRQMGMVGTLLVTE